MSNPEVEEYVRLKDVGEALLKYIGSDEYIKAVESVQSDGRAAFMSGIGISACVIMANCDKYVKYVEDK